MHLSKPTANPFHVIADRHASALLSKRCGEPLRMPSGMRDRQAYDVRHLPPGTARLIAQPQSASYTVWLHDSPPCVAEPWQCSDVEAHLAGLLPDTRGICAPHERRKAEMRSEQSPYCRKGTDWSWSKGTARNCAILPCAATSASWFRGTGMRVHTGSNLRTFIGVPSILRDLAQLCEGLSSDLSGAGAGAGMLVLFLFYFNFIFSLGYF